MKVKLTTGASLGRFQPFRVFFIAIIVILAFMAFTSLSFAADINVNPGDSIQAAIDAASPGDKIVVAAGSYSGNLTINKSLTLSGAGAASTTIAGTGGTAVTITADAVTIDGFTVSNPSGKSGIYAADHSNLAITNNIVSDIGSSDATTSGTNFGIGIVSSAAAVDSITITGNQVSQVVGGDHKSADAIAVGWSTGALDITNLLIQGNTISNITSDTSAWPAGRGAYGIIINHGTGVTGKTVAPQILDNNISDLEGLWAHGIGLEGNTPNALVQGNTIDNLVDHKSPADPDAAAIMVEDNAAADTVTISGNSFTNVWLGVRNATAMAVNATGNWWGGADPATMILNTGGGSADYSPMLGAVPGTSPMTWTTNDSIQEAIDAASPGDTINVVGGIYTGNIIVNKSLTILGDPGDGNPGPGAGAPVIDGGSSVGSAFFIANGVSDVTIRGFEMRNFINGSGAGEGNGISAWEASTSNVTIQDNYFHDLGWNAVLVGNDGALGDHSNWNISGNVLDAYDYYGFELTNASNSVISNNIIHATDSATAILAVARRNESGITISNNNIDGVISAGPEGRAAIYALAWNAGEGITNPQLASLLIEGNQISSTGGRPHVLIYGAVGGSVTGAQVHGNSLSLLKNAGDGGAVDASVNWWGDNDPSDNIVISGSGSVDYSPWLEAALGTSPMTWGTNDSIQDAIDAASPGDTINIAAGTYTENVIVNKSVTLAGSGQGSTIVQPAVSLPNPCAGSSTCGPPISASSNVIAVQADNVVIHDLAVDGDNPSLTSGIVRNGADLDARNGIITNHHAGVFNGTEIHNVTVRNIYLRGIYASSGGTFNIHDNIVQNVRGDSGSIGIMAWTSTGTIANNTVSEANDAIAANHSKGIQFLNNTVTNSGSGVHTDNAGHYGGTADLLQGNIVSDCDPDGYGVWTFVPYIAPVVDSNTVTNCAIGLSAWGGAFGPSPTVTTQFTNNTVNGPDGAAGSVGAYITTDTIGWGYTDVAVNFTGNVISGNETGVYMTADEQPWNPGAYEARTITATFSGNEIADNTVGMDKGTTDSVTADARNNWWGDASGPYNAASNATGTGNSIADGIPFIPWLGMAPISPTVAYLAPTGDIHVGNPVVTATVTPGTSSSLTAELGLAAQLDLAHPWDVTMWTFPCTVTGSDVSCPTDGLPEGVFTATVTVFDDNGHSGNDTGSFTIVDDAAPVTTDNADDDWHNTDVTVTLSCTDAVTGCAETYWSTDNGGPSGTGDTVVISNEGITTITYHSVDNDDPAHVESDKTATVKIDKTAPSTTDNAPAGWQNSDVTVTLTCDDGTLSGCDTTNWSTDQGESGTGNATITVEGDSTLTYYSTDVAGNSETPHSVHVYLDKTAPVVSYTGPSGTVYTLLTSITGTVSDAAPSSGINGATGAVMSLDNGVSFPYSCTVTGGNIDCPTPGLADGSYDVVLRVTDDAGNIGEATGAFVYDAAGQPDLRLSVKRVYWNTYADYVARELSVDYLLTNTTVGRAAEDVSVVYVKNTNAVDTLTPMPVAVGDIASDGGTGGFTLKYLLPGGVSNFKTSIWAKAYDPAGNSYDYPGPPPTI